MTSLMNQVHAIDEVAKHATKQITLNENGFYEVSDKATGRVIEEFETYREARKSV